MATILTGVNLAGQNLTNADFDSRHADQCQSQPGQPHECESFGYRPTLTGANSERGRTSRMRTSIGATLDRRELHDRPNSTRRPATRPTI